MFFDDFLKENSWDSVDLLSRSHQTHVTSKVLLSSEDESELNPPKNMGQLALRVQDNFGIIDGFETDRDTVHAQEK